MKSYQITIQDWATIENNLEILKFVVRDIQREVLNFLEEGDLKNSRELLTSQLEAALRYPSALMASFDVGGKRSGYRILNDRTNLIGTAKDQHGKSYYLVEDGNSNNTIIHEDGYYWQPNFLDLDNIINLNIPDGTIGKKELAAIKALSQ